jgi:ribosomal protein L34
VIAAHHHGEGPLRLGDVSSQTLGQLAVSEGSRLGFAEQPDTRERPQEAHQRVRMNTGSGGEVLDRSRPVGQSIGKRQPRSDIDHLQDLISGDHAGKR